MSELPSRRRRDRRRVELCLSSALLALTGTTALAQTALAQTAPAAAPTEVGQIVVTGEAYALQRAIDTKRAQTVVSDTVSSSEIGAIPEFGLGEALQRVPGVSFVINNGRGEAQFATVRGLNPDYNSVTVDGVALPSTEETRRSVSFDVLPSILANQVSVYKTYTADQPSDAIGGVTNLRTHSAFDHQGVFAAGHVDLAYWENERKFHPNRPSGQGDLRLSKTFGPNDQFGALVLVSYYGRSSNSLNSYSLPYSYYPYTGGTQTVSAVALTPTTSVDRLVPVPDRRRWYFYDNIRQRPGVYGKLEFDDHQRFHAHLSAGLFRHLNNEHRYSSYLNRGPATATFTSPSSASFATGVFETDYDRYNQYRQILFYEAGGGIDLDDKTHLNVVANYGLGFYRQDTIEDVFTTATSATFASNYVGQVEGVPLFQPATASAYSNAANYAQVYHLIASDRSRTQVPQIKADFTHNVDADSTGLGYQFGYQHRQTRQAYYYHEYRLNALAAAGVSLATIGPLGGGLTPYDSNGLNLILVDPAATGAYVAAHPSAYTVAASNVQRSTLNNFALKETIDAGYGSVSYRAGPLYAQLGLRYEATRQVIDNFQPSPLTSTTNFVQVETSAKYDKLLPTLNAAYDLAPNLKLRGAVSRTLGRARYSDLAQNSALTLSGTTATEVIANPNLKPRTSTNYDLSLEYYPRAGTALSAALFRKDIKNEIFSLTTTQQNVSLPGFTGSNYTLITTTPSNAGSARAQGLEFGFNQARLDFLPGLLSHFGLSANLSLIRMDAPSVQMNDRVTYRKLPQLLESTKATGNLAIFYTYGGFSGEVAYNHTGKMPITFDLTNAVNDQWYRATNTVDAQVSYRLRRGLELRIQGKNLTNETSQKVVGPNQALNYSLLNNGRAYYAGVSFVY